MPSNDTFPQRLTKIDDLTRGNHYYLEADDQCLFLGEYTARQGFSFSATNQLILNFKKSVSLRGTPQWPHKERAILTAAAALRAAIPDTSFARVTLVPIPPSKAKTDALYDDRLLRTLQKIRPNPPLDIRELVIQRTSMVPVHDSENRPSPATLAANYVLDATHSTPAPGVIALFDDVLTTGSHFKACQIVLRQAFPGVPIIGIFIARRAPEAVDFSAIFPDVES